MKTFSVPEQRFLWGSIIVFLVVSGGSLFRQRDVERALRARLVDAPVDVNTGEFAMIARLRGFTPLRALRVMEARAVAPLEGLADLDRVAGLSPDESDRVATQVSFGPGPVMARIPLKTATMQELAAIPGIGAAIATRIVEARDARGELTSLDDLAGVRGLGRARLGKLAQVVSLGRAQD